jgi:aerotaxis receptor
MNRLDRGSPPESDFEAPFDVSELFISRTDKRGIIQSGNPVFVRVSAYPREKLIGSPHNIIRHPDMPRGVFRLFWQTISEGQNMVAYVKNRDAHGRFYWVLATVFPHSDGYISTRIKPTSALLAKVEALYKDMLVVEKEKGVEASLAVLDEFLKEAGYPNYRTFMIQALKTELLQRDAELETQLPKLISLKSDCASLLLELRDSIVEVATRFKAASLKVSDLEKMKQKSEVSTQGIAQRVSCISALSINMSISAQKMAKEGAALSVIATTVQKLAQEVLETFERYRAAYEISNASLENSLFSILRIRVNLEMLSFFFLEIASLMSKNCGVSAESSQMVEEAKTLVQIAHELSAENSVLQAKLLDDVRKLARESELLNGQLVRLGLVRTGAKLEGARTDQSLEIFGPFVDELSLHICAVEPEVAELSAFLSACARELSEISASARLVEYCLSELRLSLSIYSGERVAAKFGEVG